MSISTVWLLLLLPVSLQATGAGSGAGSSALNPVKAASSVLPPAGRTFADPAVTGRIVQEIEVPDTLAGWSAGWTANLNGSQSAYSNWSKGGVNNLSITGSSEFSTFYRRQYFSYGLRLRTSYGQSSVEGEGVRKTDDRISLRNRFLYQPVEDDRFRLFGNLNFETQFADGFEYGTGPDGGNILISSFLSPAYFTQSAGIAFIPGENFSVEAGLGLKQTLVSDTSLSTRYGLEPGQRVFGEAGFTTGISYENEILENVIYTGYVETFTNLDRAVRRTDVTLSKRLTGKINSYLNMTLQFDMMYDDDFSEELQLSQVLSAGLSFIFF